MALIKCIECGKDVSDKATACPNCGCPITESIKEIQLEKDKNKDKLFFSCPICKKQFPNGTLKCDLCGYDVIPQPIQRNISTNPECLYCHSTNTKKISSTSRVASLLTFGFASKKMGKQWHCNKCGSDF